VIKDLRQIDYEFETEALADFKYQIGSHTNRTSQENLTHQVEQLYTTVLLPRRRRYVATSRSRGCLTTEGVIGLPHIFP
jgi:hypothetical protein